MIKSIAASYVPRLVEFLTAPVCFIVITKSLDEYSYGSYQIILNIVNFSLPVLTLGLAKYMNYCIPGEGLEKQYKYFFNVVVMEVFVYVCGLMILVYPFREYLAKLLKFPLSPHWLWLAPLVWTIYLVEQRILGFIGLKKRLPLKALLTSLEQAFYILMLLGVYVLSVSIKRIVAARILSYFLIMFLSMFFLKGRLLLRSRMDKSLVLDALKYSFPLIFVETSMICIQTIDRFMLSYFNSVKEVGLYSYASGFLQMAYYLGSPLLWALYPFFAEAYRRKSPEKDRIFFLQFSWTLVICAIAVSGLVADRFVLVPLVSRREYLQAGFTFDILLLYPVGLSMMYLYQQILLLEKDTKIIGFLFVIAAVMNIILNVFLIPHYAEKGAALASIISIWFMVVAFYLRCRRYRISLFPGWIVRFGLFWAAWFSYLVFTRPFVHGVVSLCLIHTFPVILFLVLFKVIDFPDLFRMLKTRE